MTKYFGYFCEKICRPRTFKNCSIWSHCSPSSSIQGFRFHRDGFSCCNWAGKVYSRHGTGLFRLPTSLPLTDRVGLHTCCLINSVWQDGLHIPTYMFKLCRYVNLAYLDMTAMHFSEKSVLEHHFGGPQIWIAKKKNLQPAGFEPTTSLLHGMCSTAVLQPLTFAVGTWYQKFGRFCQLLFTKVNLSCVVEYYSSGFWSIHLLTGVLWCPWF